jgi:MFS family permease
LLPITPVEDRRKAFSLLYFGINIGVSLGPIAAGFLFENYRRWIFRGDALTALTGLLLVAFLVREPHSAEVHRGGFREDADESGALAFVPAGMSWILLTTVIWTLGEIIFATNSVMSPLAILDRRDRAAGTHR